MNVISPNVCKGFVFKLVFKIQAKSTFIPRLFWYNTQADT